MRGKGREGGRIGKGRGQEGRRGGMGVVGREGEVALDMGSAPLETLWIRPCKRGPNKHQHNKKHAKI